MEKEYKLCQYCSMPLKEGRGTEKDSLESIIYCHCCYENVEFIDKEMTLEKMEQIVEDALKEKVWIKQKKVIAAAYGLKNIKRGLINKQT